jgi:hypothetical protein
VLEAGTEIKGYRIERLLGRGGMGEVYEATQLGLSRRVAFKVVYSALTHDEAFVERFEREGRLQAALDHPHVVTVYEAGELENGLFLAMRLVEGSTLKELIGKRGLDATRAVRLLRPVADALDAAHAVGVVHRDVKPQNILVTSNDYPYLADFGLVRAEADSALTRSGHFVGTIHYAAPEQILAQPSGPPADVYALAAVLYECLAGSVPFPRGLDAAVLYAHVSDAPPSASAQRDDLPVGIDEVIAAGMAKQPEERPASAGELIERAAAVLKTDARVPGSRPRAPTTVLARGLDQADETKPAPAPRAPASATTASAAATPTTVPAVRMRRPRLVPVLAAAAIALTAAGGFLAGRGGDGDGGGEPGALTVSASNGVLSVRAPQSWERVASDAVPAIPGLDLAAPMGLADTARPASGVSVGTTRATGSTLLPTALRRRLSGPLPEPERVRAGELAALRYRRVPVRGFDRALTLYAAPMSAGVVTAACYGPTAGSEQFGGDCERIVQSVELLRGRPRPLGGTPELAAATKRIVDDLNRALRRDRRRLTRAGGAPAQSTAAEALASDYSRAARRIDALAPGPALADATAQVAASLRAAGRGYRSLAAAARESDLSAYRNAQESLRAAESRSQRRLGSLERRLARG